MYRRDLKRMLTKSPNAFLEKTWVQASIVVGVLGLGVGIGVSLGNVFAQASAPGSMEAKAHQTWEQAEMALPQPEKSLIPESPPAPKEEPPPLVKASLPTPSLPEPEEPPPLVVEAAVSRPGPPPPVSMTLATMIPPQPPGTEKSPAWLRNAVASPPVMGRPMIAIVIDDLGVDRKRSERASRLPGPLTLAWMTYANDLPHLTQAARAQGHELIIHVPMQPLSSTNPGPDVLEVGLSTEEIRRRLLWGLSRFEGYVGINNHMGSKFTGNTAGMQVVLQELKNRGLLFLDSVTTEKSVAPELARNLDLPFAVRNIFLDNEQSVPVILGQLARAEAHARKYGSAIAIGHPHDTTIEALSQWLPTLPGKGFVLVPLTTIVKAGQNTGHNTGKVIPAKTIP